MLYLGELAALVTAFLWSGTSIAFTEASTRVGSVAVNITRLMLALVYLSATILLLKLDLEITFSQITFLGLSGLVGLVFGDGFLFKSFQHIGARLSMLIMSLAPPISAILAYFFLGEFISFLEILGILVTILGIAIVVLQKQENPYSKYKISRIGILYAFLGAVGQGIGLILAKFAFNQGEINGFVATFYRMIPAIIVLFPLTILIQKSVNPFKVYIKNSKAFLYTIVGSIIGPYLGITFSLIAIANTYVGIAATIMATVPVIMLPLVKYYYREKLSLLSILGAFIAVGGIGILFLAK